MSDQINTPPVPYIVYDEEQARNERNLKRLVIALIISICLIFATNALWLYCWFQYDYVGEEEYTQTIDVDAKEGVANYVGRDGDIVNGKDSSDNGSEKNESQKEVK